MEKTRHIAKYPVIECKNSPSVFNIFLRVILWESSSKSFGIAGRVFPRPRLDLHILGKYFHIGVWKRTLVKRPGHITGRMYNDN